MCDDRASKGKSPRGVICLDGFPTPVNADTLADKRRQSKPRAHVTDAYQRSHERYGELYKKLAE
jgi:hypothetical protein